MVGKSLPVAGRNRAPCNDETGVYGFSLRGRRGQKMRLSESLATAATRSIPDSQYA